MDVFTVSRLNQLIKRTLDREYVFKNFYVSGVLANVKRHSSGHYYFTLKDDEASIDVALWSSTARGKSYVKELANGLEVTIRGTLNFYEKMGRLTLTCNDLAIGHKSAYQMRFEALQAELAALGYFEEIHKKAIPSLAACIGIVTSASGAVLHDILHIASQRNPLVKFKVFDVPVQGEKASLVIAKGIAKADADKDVDLIIVGRGGGSNEDLWCFNERAVVEAVYHCQTPIISAVGHETDYTLCDYAADVRGATPSHAAELAIMPLHLLIMELERKAEYLQAYMQHEITARRQALFAIFNRRLGLPALTMLNRQKQLLLRAEHTLTQAVTRQRQNKEQNLVHLGEKLGLLNPVSILLRGYSKVEGERGQAITGIKQVSLGDEISLTLADGTLKATIKEVTEHGGYIEKL